MSIARHRELLILGVVRSHAMHGYALAEALDAGLGRALGIKRPNLYALLQRLEDRGLLTHTTRKGEGGPDRRIYRLTKKGERGYQELLSQCWSHLEDATLPLPVLISTLGELPAADRISALQAAVEWAEQRLKNLRGLPAHNGHAGESLKLLEKHYALDIRHLKQLLKFERPSSS